MLIHTKVSLLLGRKTDETYFCGFLKGLSAENLLYPPSSCPFCVSLTDVQKIQCLSLALDVSDWLIPENT